MTESTAPSTSAAVRRVADGSRRKPRAVPEHRRTLPVRAVPTHSAQPARPGAASADGCLTASVLPRLHYETLCSTPSRRVNPQVHTKRRGARGDAHRHERRRRRGRLGQDPAAFERRVRGVQPTDRQSMGLCISPQRVVCGRGRNPTLSASMLGMAPWIAFVRRERGFIPRDIASGAERKGLRPKAGAVWRFSRRGPSRPVRATGPAARRTGRASRV